MNLPVGHCDFSGREVMSTCCTSEGQPSSKSQDRQAWRIGIILVVSLLFSLSFTLGCAAVLTPMKPGADSSVKPDEGLVIGRIHVTGSGGEPLASADEPFHVPSHIQWRVKNEALGKDFVIDGLPSDGPFMLKLPTGSYQLTAFSFDTALGIWQASLPASFTVHSQGCTYLGTWELRTRTGFFDGSIARQVFDQPSLAERDLKIFLDDVLGSPMVTQLSSEMASPLILTFRTQGTDLTSPP